MTDGAGLECFWGSLKDHPKCPHGPTLLFGKRIDGELKEFYACSACRDRKLCNFYLEKGQQLSKVQQNAWQEETKKLIQSYHHRKYFIRFNELLNEHCDKRAYCHTCERLTSTNDLSKHKNHEITSSLTDEQMRNPSTLLKPLDNPKKEAQFLFSKKATVDITNLLVNAGAKLVLCIGTPRIHEYISQNCEDKMTSLLLDFDGRYHNFFGPLSFCWYNLFNHHFFNKEAEGVFKDFLTQNHGNDVYLVCDPPFGARLEFISQTIKTISDLHRKWNGLMKKEDANLKILFIFPYFMESIMQIKSNPPGISGGLRELKMSDFKVDYDNHPLFVTGSNGRKYGSPVRIFTNIPLDLFVLPEVDGYKYCKRCAKWIAKENKHCKMCKACTSKDGRRYKHCKICSRCVKPTWQHCAKCERCILKAHKCGEKPKVTGHCFKCNETDHIAKDCPKGKENDEKIPSKSGVKRKNKETNVNSLVKKQKTNGSIAVMNNKKKLTTHEKVETIEKKHKEKKSKINTQKIIEGTGKKLKKSKILKQRVKT